MNSELVPIGPHANLLADAKWVAIARRKMDELYDAMAELRKDVINVGRLLYEVEIDTYYAVDGFETYGELLTVKAWNRRFCNKISKAYDLLVITSRIETDQLEDVDIDLILEAKPNFSTDRSPKIVESAKLVAAGDLPVEEFRQLWVKTSFTTEHPTPRNRNVSAAPERSKVVQSVEGALGWTPSQIVEFLDLLAKGLARTSMLGPEEVAKIMVALEPSARHELIRELFKTTDFFDEIAITTVLRSGIRSLGRESILKIADDLEKALATGSKRAAVG